MKRTYRIISLIVLASFVINTAFPGGVLTPAFAYQNDTYKLSPPLISDDLKDTEYKRIGNLRFLLECKLEEIAEGRASDLPSRPEDFNKKRFRRGEIQPGVYTETVRVDSEAWEKSVNSSFQAHFFFNKMQVLPNGYYLLQCSVSVKDKKTTREDYYAVFSPKRDKDGGFKIDIYTEKEYKKYKDSIARGVLPQRKTKEQGVISDYVEHEKVLDKFWRDKVREGQSFKCSQPQISGLLGRIDLLRQFGELGLLRYEEIRGAILGRDLIFVRAKDEELPVIHMKDAVGVVREVKVSAHSSSYAVWIALDEREWQGLMACLEGKKPASRGVEIAAFAGRFNNLLMHEIGVMCGLSARAADTGRGHFVARNELDELRHLAREEALVLPASERLAKLQTKLVNIAPVNLEHLRGVNAAGEEYSRDYAAAGESGITSWSEGELARRFVETLSPDRSQQDFIRGLKAIGENLGNTLVSRAQVYALLLRFARTRAELAERADQIRALRGFARLENTGYDALSAKFIALLVLIESGEVASSEERALLDAALLEAAQEILVEAQEPGNHINPHLTDEADKIVRASKEKGVIFRPLQGIEHKDIARIEINTEDPILLTLGENKEFKAEKSVFSKAVIKFMLLTPDILSTRYYALRCEIKDDPYSETEARVYYVICERGVAKERDRPLEVLTLGEYRKFPASFKDLDAGMETFPRRRGPDRVAIDRYKEHERSLEPERKAVDEWIERKMEEGDYAVAEQIRGPYGLQIGNYIEAKYTFGYSEQKEFIDEFLGLRGGRGEEGLLAKLGVRRDAIERLRDILYSKPLVVIRKNRDEELPVVTMFKEKGTPWQMPVYSHSSDGALYIVLENDLFDTMITEEFFHGIDPEIPGFFSIFSDKGTPEYYQAIEMLRERLFSEICTHFGLLSTVTPDGLWLTNLLIEAKRDYENQQAWYQPNPDLAKLDPVESFDKILPTRDYAGAADETPEPPTAGLEEMAERRMERAERIKYLIISVTSQPAQASMSDEIAAYEREADRKTLATVYGEVALDLIEALMRAMQNPDDRVFSRSQLSTKYGETFPEALTVFDTLLSTHFNETEPHQSDARWRMLGATQKSVEGHLKGAPSRRAGRGKPGRSPSEALEAIAMEIEEMEKLAEEAAKEIPIFEGERYTLLVPFYFYGKRDIFEEHERGCENIFKLEYLNANEPEGLADEILEKIKAGKLPDNRTIALLPIGTPREKLEALKKARIRFVQYDIRLTQVYAAVTEKSESMQKFLQTAYATMLLARRVDEKSIRENTAVYQLLSFYLRSHFHLSEVDAEDYIKAMADDNPQTVSAVVATLVKGSLTLRPAARYDAQKEYDRIAEIFLSA
ncbi:MAG: hypothetical protein ISS90_01260 [Candidatus Omnitrophica bacterium]|nr:hypothetical protein [Candidatus Omnitrophota bacterium]